MIHAYVARHCCAWTHLDFPTTAYIGGLRRWLTARLVTQWLTSQHCRRPMVVAAGGWRDRLWPQHACKQWEILRMRVASMISPEASFQVEPGPASPLTHHAGRPFTLVVDVFYLCWCANSMVIDNAWSKTCCSGKLFLTSHKLGLVQKLLLHHPALYSIVEGPDFGIYNHMWMSLNVTSNRNS